MADEHKMIQELLESFQGCRKSINREIEKLWTSGRCEEADVDRLKSAIGDLYKVDRTLRNFLVSVLTPGYRSETVRNNLLKLQVLEALKKSDVQKTAVDKFISDDLGSKDGG